MRNADRATWTLPPYLLWALAWFGFFLFALNVRVATGLWEPVFLWVSTQVQLIELATGDLGRVAVMGVVLICYVITGCLLWLAIEIRRDRAPGRAWARSGLAWAILQLSSMAIAWLLNAP